MLKTALLVGRWHAVTRDQEAALCASLKRVQAQHVVIIITAANQSGTKRHPLSLAERTQLVEQTAQGLGCSFEIHGLNDTNDSDWVGYLRKSVRDESNGRTLLNPADTVVVSANPDVIGHFRAAGYTIERSDFNGLMPSDVLAAIRTGKPWRELANAATVNVYERNGLDRRIMDIFEDVLLTDDGELSTGRDFAAYAAGMDASSAMKINDICPWIRPGRIVDKGCGTGRLGVHLSALFPQSEIILMDLSRELLHTAESQHYAHQNVSVVRGNIIHQRFPAGTVDTEIFGSVMHEVFSYTDYDRDQVRLTLTNSRLELVSGGRLIIRDGVMPPNPSRKVWMKCDEETQERFRRFARDFKRTSTSPGVPFAERKHGSDTWFVLTLHFANEFLSKKDYLKNWDIETKEEFGVFTLEEWRRELLAHKFKVVHLQSYLNDWILVNRYLPFVRLRSDCGTRPGKVLQFPDTTAMIVGEAA